MQCGLSLLPVYSFEIQYTHTFYNPDLIMNPTSVSSIELLITFRNYSNYLRMLIYRYIVKFVVKIQIYNQEWVCRLPKGTLWFNKSLQAIGKLPDNKAITIKPVGLNDYHDFNLVSDIACYCNYFSMLIAGD